MYRLRTQKIILGIFITLAAVGLLLNLQQYYIPLIIVAVVFLLYKFPPGTRRRPKVKPSRKTQAKIKAARTAGMKAEPSQSSRKKRYPFQVIEGSKGKSDDEDMPKYH
ncbi:hypothetical protein ACH6EH_00070 [Paenibacillus sp. JSM ZJ436]|uniref:hypothetical protein n=1 Tax=Paenibacillus sp. JSM ZJ436 TaxID=3376190 RepID=UPI0037946874